MEKKLGLRELSLCASCGVEPHTIAHVFYCSSHPTPMTEIDVLERPRLTSGFLFGLPFFDLLPLPPPPPEPPPSGRQEC